MALAFLTDGQLVVTSQAGPIRFIDPESGEELRRIEAPPETSEGQVRLGPDGMSFITWGMQGAMRYDLASGEPMWHEPAPPVDCFESAYVERLGQMLCGDQRSGQIRAIDLRTGRSASHPCSSRPVAYVRSRSVPTGHGS